MAKKRKYITWLNPRSGKITRERIINSSSNPNENTVVTSPIDTKDYLVRVIPCPFKIHSPEVKEKLTRPIKKANFKFDVEVDISLKMETDHIKPEHEILYDIHPSELPAGTDLTEYEIDVTLGSYQCEIPYKVEPKIRVSLSKKEIIEDKEVAIYKENIIKEAEEATKDWEAKLLIYDQSPLNDLFDQMSKHFEEYLANEIKRVANRLVFEVHTINEAQEIRDEHIKIMVSEEESELRKRIITEKGRKPLTKQKDYEIEKEKFLDKCILSLGQLEKRRKKLNKTQLAEILVEEMQDSNPLQTLRRKLKVFDLTFESILQQYTEQKSS